MQRSASELQFHLENVMTIRRCRSIYLGLSKKASDSPIGRVIMQAAPFDHTKWTLAITWVQNKQTIGYCLFISRLYYEILII